MNDGILILKLRVPGGDSVCDAMILGRELLVPINEEREANDGWPVDVLAARWEKARQAVKKESAKRKRENVSYAECRRIVRERSGGVCEGIPLREHQCAGPLACHHKYTRKRYPKRWTDPDACLDLCDAIHRWTHANPAEAEAVGLLVESDH